MESFEETPTAKVDTNASRHAEWTADKVIMMGVNDFAIAYNIADAHNASLNKERGRCERGLCKGAALFAGKEAETIQQLRTQLAKLDKAHKEACEICREAIIKRDKYQRQLAAAQAAITVFRKNWPKTH
ncbi:MAG TPA: hypothetical protein VFG51_01215, partial [Candidatus Saccharimonadia bacterium]|nr:hypothetical protein [Candidatus Saccharimonadia bacterium]